MRVRRLKSAVTTNRPLIISVSVNVVLLGLGISLCVRHSRQATRSADTNATILSSAAVAQSKTTHHSPPQPGESPRPTPFDWRQVESPDYREYIANLRSIGCPEKTIKEIITADVNDLFSVRRAGITQTNHYEYWRAFPVSLTEDQRKQLQELSVQRIDVLKALGVEPSDMADLIAEYYRSDMESKGREIEFLSEPKRQNVKDLLFQMAQQQLAAKDEPVKAADIEQKTQSAIKSLLTADEFRDYELRTSVPASQLREVLKEMEPTEQEFKSIFESWTALNSHQPGSPEYREGQQSSEAALQSLLGPDRFELYLKGVKMLGYSK